MPGATRGGQSSLQISLCLADGFIKEGAELSPLHRKEQSCLCPNHAESDHRRRQSRL